MPNPGTQSVVVDRADEGTITLRRFSRKTHKRLKQWALDHDVSLEHTFNLMAREWLTLKGEK
jgi:hypothetical protein